MLRLRALVAAWLEARSWHDTALEPRFVPVEEYHRFRRGEIGAASFLREHGFVVFRGVLTQDECDSTLELLWDFLEACEPGLSRDDERTWDDHWPRTVEGGILPFNGAGQSAAAWAVRGNKAVHACFAQIWNVQSLVSSFDAMSVWRPWAGRLQRRRRRRTERGWFHIDQNPLEKPGFACVQGLVNLLPMNSAGSTGGNVLVARSHEPRWFPGLYRGPHRKLVEAMQGEDWFALPRTSPLLALLRRTSSSGVGVGVGVGRESHPEALTLQLAAGDLLLWDSRTVHCSSPGNDGAPAPVATVAPRPAAEGRRVGQPLLRAVVFVCMLPQRRLFSPSNLKQRCPLGDDNHDDGASQEEALRVARRAAVDAGITTSHWPDRYPEALTSYLDEGGGAGGDDRERAATTPEIRRKVLLRFADLNEHQRQLVEGCCCSDTSFIR